MEENIWQVFKDAPYNVQVFGIGVDMTPAEVGEFVDDLGLTFPNLADPLRIAWSMYRNTDYYQVNVVIDQNLTVRWTEDFDYSEGAIVATIADLLGIDCTDVDGDYYAIEGDACGQADCDDADPNINPGVSERGPAGNCDDGKDNDCDGLVDTDPECDEVCFIGALR